MADQTPAPTTADGFRALVTGDVITKDGVELRFVRFRGGKATCVNDATDTRVNLFPEPESPPA